MECQRAFTPVNQRHIVCGQPCCKQKRDLRYQTARNRRTSEKRAAVATPERRCQICQQRYRNRLPQAITCGAPACRAAQSRRRANRGYRKRADQRQLARYLEVCEQRWQRYRIEIDFSYRTRIFTIRQGRRDVARPHEDWERSGQSLFDWALAVLAEGHTGQQTDNVCDVTEIGIGSDRSNTNP